MYPARWQRRRPDLPELLAQPLETDARSVAIEDDEQAGDQSVSSDEVVGEYQFVW